MTVPVQEQLRAFATTLLERRGAIVDWPAASGTGTALVTPETAAVVGIASDEVPLTTETAAGGLNVNLAGDFLEWAGRLLDAEPRVGLFRVRQMYLKRKEVAEAVARTFTWLNAKVTLREARETTADYHTWSFHGVLSSEERWETCFSFSLNARSGAAVDIGEPLKLWELEPRHDVAGPGSLDRASAVAERRLLQMAAAFLDRMDVRLQRDRNRLADYYNALLRESGKKKTRGHAPPDTEAIAATKRAVQLELQRKLGELDERYAIEATLRPVVLIRTELPVLAVDLTVFRKQARKGHTIYWNPLLKQFEPLVCGHCGEGVFAVAFTNDDVLPLCAKCAG